MFLHSESANTVGWPAQSAMEEKLFEALKQAGFNPIRGNKVNPATGHGFISSQKMGMEVFRGIPKDERVIVATAVWQYR